MIDIIFLVSSVRAADEAMNINAAALFFSEYMIESESGRDNMDGLRKGYYKSIGAQHYFIVNEFAVICEQISGAIRPGPNVAF